MFKAKAARPTSETVTFQVERNRISTMHIVKRTKDDDRGNMLDDLDSSPIIMENGGEDGFDENGLDNKLIGINEESLSMAQVLKSFKIAKSRILSHFDLDDYLYTGGPAKIESDQQLGSIGNPDSNYSKALFYMYG